MLYIRFALNSLALVSMAVWQIAPKLCDLTQAIYYLKFLWERNQTWFLWLRITHKVATKVSARTDDYFKVQPGDDLFPNSFKWLLAGFSSSWVLAKTIPQCLAILHCATHNTAPCFHQSKRWKIRWKPVSFYTLIMKVTFPHFYYNLFIRCTSLGLAHPKRGEFYKGMTIRNLRSLKIILEAIHHTLLFFFMEFSFSFFL